jgi:hypothetical protein
MTDRAAPRTEAGRRLLAETRQEVEAAGRDFNEGFVDAILAIEREAAKSGYDQHRDFYGSPDPSPAATPDLRAALERTVAWIEQECRPDASFVGQGHNWSMSDDERERGIALIEEARAALAAPAATADGRCDYRCSLPVAHAGPHLFPTHTLESQPAPALDVERLAKAMQHPARGDWNPEQWEVEDEARAIVAEYARLSSSEKVSGSGEGEG